MKNLIVVLTVLSLCSVNLAGSSNLNGVNPGALATSVCSFTFTSGANNNYLQYCVTVNGNITQIQTPLGHHQIPSGAAGEGYGICDVGPATSYYDWADFGDSGNWNAPTTVTHNATEVKIARTTTDGAWTLTQTITQAAPSIKVAMTLKNNAAASKTVNLVRYANAHPDATSTNNFDGTQNSAFVWNSIGSGTSPFGLIMENVGTSPFSGYNGLAQMLDDPPDPCNYAKNWHEGPILDTNVGSLVMVYVGTLTAHQSKTFTVSYKGL
jgi:hypothetical protein